MFMMRYLKFEVLVDPVPLARPRFARGRVYLPKRSRASLSKSEPLTLKKKKWLLKVTESKSSENKKAAFQRLVVRYCLKIFSISPHVSKHFLRIAQGSIRVSQGY